MYAPRPLNDRFVLGMQGSMAEYALGLMRQRARRPSNKKSAAALSCGQCRWACAYRGPSTGKEGRPSGATSAGRGVKQLRALGSARQTMRWDRDAQLPLPEVHPGTAGHDIIWQLPSGHRLHQMLTNPCYAGALVSGRTETKTVIKDGRARQSTRRKKPLEQWRIVLLEQHPGYISWDMFSRTTSSWRPIAPCQQKRPVELPNGGRRAQWLAAVWALRPQAPGRL